MGPGLTPAQVAAFDRDGYLVVPDALDGATVAGLLAETQSLLAAFSLDDHPMTRFSTGTGAERGHVGDDYFLTSGDKVRFFLEENAVAADGRLLRPQARAVNKIGHGLHLRSGPFADVLAVAPAAIARSLGFRDPHCLQSMVICKQPEIGGAVPPHQDSTFLFTEPPSAVGFWYALEDATTENGCLALLPGSHKWAPITRRLVRRADAGVELVDNLGARFPPGAEFEAAPPAGTDTAEYVVVEVKAGTLVLIHGNVLHKSERNLSPKTRIIYTFHLIEADGPAYDHRNWLQPPPAGFTALYRQDRDD